MAAITIGLWSARCSPVNQGAGSTLPDAGPVDAGTGADAGSGSGGGTVDAGSGTGGTVDAGSGTGGGTVDAGSGTGTADAGSGTGGGGIAAGCEGAMPDGLGTAVTGGITPSGDDQECWASTSDESGNVAMEAHRSDTNPFLDAPHSSQTTVHWVMLRSDGSRVADTFLSYGLFPQPSGFHGVRWSDSAPPKEFLRYWSSNGQEHDNPNAIGNDEGPALLARAWRDGAVAAHVTVSDTQIPQGYITFRRFDATGNKQFETGRSIPTPGVVVGLAQDASGPAVAFLMPFTGGGKPTGDLYVYWAEFNPPPDGGREGQEKLLATGVDPSNFVAHPLVDGGVAVRINGAWAGVLKPFETTFRPAPAWLADHPDHDFTIVRGERAYALIQGGSNSMELVSKQGNSCGSVTFPDVGGVTSGADGTVIGASGPGGCTKKWWPGLLR